MSKLELVGDESSASDASGSEAAESDGAPRDWPALAVGGLRCASGISFLVAPERANRAWGDEAELGATASLLLRSMGYRDALVGGLLCSAGWRGTGAPSGTWPQQAPMLRTYSAGLRTTIG